MSEPKKPLVIKFAENPNVQFYENPNIEPVPVSDTDLGDVTFTVHYTPSWPWWIRGPIMFWTWLTGGHRNN